MAITTAPLAKHLDAYDIDLKDGMLWVAHNETDPVYDIVSDDYRFLVTGTTEQICVENAKKLFPSVFQTDGIRAVCAPTVSVLHTHRLLNLDGKRVSIGNAHGIRQTALSPVCSPGGKLYPALDNFLYFAINIGQTNEIGFLMKNHEGEEGVSAYSCPHNATLELGSDAHSEDVFIASLPLGQLGTREWDNVFFRGKCYDIRSLLQEAINCVDSFDSKEFSDENK